MTGGQSHDCRTEHRVVTAGQGTGCDCRTGDRVMTAGQNTGL